MAVMVDGAGGSGGGWIDITDSVTVSQGKRIRDGGSTSAVTIVNDANQAYVLIDDVQPGEHYRVIGWQDLRAALLDSSENVVAGSIMSDVAYNDRGFFGNGLYVQVPAGSLKNPVYVPIEFVVPKIQSATSLLVTHDALAYGFAYDDVIVEKYIG